MHKFDVKSFGKNNCDIAKDSLDIFLGLFKITNGNPCETGCAWFKGGKCKGYMYAKASAIAKSPRFKKDMRTNKELAILLATTARQVSKMRKEGTLLSRLSAISKKEVKNEEAIQVQ